MVSPGALDRVNPQLVSPGALDWLKWALGCVK